jgi:hypothetical protein
MKPIEGIDWVKEKRKKTKIVDRVRWCVRWLSKRMMYNANGTLFERSLHCHSQTLITALHIVFNFGNTLIGMFIRVIDALKNPCRRFYVDQNVDPTLKKHVADFTTAKSYSPRRSKSIKSILLFILVIV